MRRTAGTIALNFVVVLVRLLARILAVVVPLGLAVVGLAVAVFSIQGGREPLSLPTLTGLLGIDVLGREVGRFLGALEASGPVAVVAGLCGLGAMLVGWALIAGSVAPSRAGTLQLASSDEGTLAAQRSALADVATSLGRRVDGVTDVKASVRGWRSKRGRLKVRAARSPAVDARTVEDAVAEKLRGLEKMDPVSVRVRSRRGDDGSRVQ
ncbi:MAG: hypothetical protein ACR2NA_05495 [Solirubrobacterales bacterium]